MVQQYAAPMSAIGCSCDPTRRCPACVDQAMMWFSGMAALRGGRWAEDVARRRPGLLRRPWPPNDGRAAELARAKVRDLSEDPGVVDRLAVKLAEHAARRWAALQVAARLPS
jgi:hypothetical protein